MPWSYHVRSAGGDHTVGESKIVAFLSFIEPVLSRGLLHSMVIGEPVGLE